MSLRAAPLHPEYVRAVNSIDTVFDRHNDKPIRDSWAKVLSHLNTSGNNSPVWDEKLMDLQTDLYQAIGKRVGYNHTVEYIKHSAYQPRYFNQMETEQTQIRQMLAKILSESGLRVVISQQENPNLKK